MTIRNASSADIPALCALERECFSQPWTEKGFEEFFANDCSRCFVAEDGGVVCGYIGLYLICGEAEITNVAVAGTHRRRGVGGRLIEAVLAVDGAERVSLDVRESNAAARGLYGKYGFKIDGIRRGFYAKPREDAVLMSRDITTVEENLSC